MAEQTLYYAIERAITAAKRDPDGGKVLLPLDVAEALLRALRQ